MAKQKFVVLCLMPGLFPGKDHPPIGEVVELDPAEVKDLIRPGVLQPVGKAAEAAPPAAPPPPPKAPAASKAAAAAAAAEAEAKEKAERDAAAAAEAEKDGKGD